MPLHSVVALSPSRSYTAFGKNIHRGLPSSLRIERPAAGRHALPFGIALVNYRG